MQQSHATKDTPATDKVFHFSNGSEPEYLDPGLISDAVSSNVVINLFEGLTEYDSQTLAVKPGVATHWKVSADKKTYTFYLRQNAKWSDGSNLTAHDFVYSWQRVLKPETASKYAFIMYFMKNAKAINHGKQADVTKLGAKALDAYTLQVQLEHPAPFFPAVAGWYTYRPVKKDIVEKYKEKWTLPEHFVGNGFFKLSEWIPQKHIALVRNEHYWDKKNVHLDKVMFYALEDRETALKQFMKGDIHFTYDPPPVKLPTLRTHPEFMETPCMANYLIILNTEEAPLDNKKFRQALAHAIDRKQFVKIMNQGVASANYTPLGLGSYVPPKGNEFNPEKARALLKDAGFESNDQIPEITMVYNTKAQHKMAMEILQNMWKRHLGIEVTLQNMEFKVLIKRQNSKDYQISRFGWYGDYSDPNTFLEIFLSDSTGNHTNWKNAEYDALIAKAMHVSEIDKRNRLYYQAESILMDESPVIPIFTVSMPALLSKKISGFYGNAMSYYPMKHVKLAD